MPALAAPEIEDEAAWTELFNGNILRKEIGDGNDVSAIPIPSPFSPPLF